MLQVNSEFYTGWLDHWGDQHAVVDSQKVSRVLGEMLTMGASVNMYVSPNLQYSQTFLLSVQMVKGCLCSVFLVSTNPKKRPKATMCCF